MKDFFSSRWGATIALRAFAFARVPTLLFMSPSIQEITDERCVVKIPLNWRTKNHLGSMYFGVLCAGADVAGGIMAMRLLQKQGLGTGLSFKALHAEFLKRAEGDTLFTCTDGLAIQALVEKAKEGNRVEMPVQILATVPSKRGQEPVARFELTLSLKAKKSAVSPRTN